MKHNDAKARRGCFLTANPARGHTCLDTDHALRRLIPGMANGTTG